MKVQMISPASLGNSADKWKELFNSMAENDQQAQVSLATPADHSAALSLLHAPAAGEALKGLSAAPEVCVHLHFESGVAHPADVQTLYDIANTASNKAAAASATRQQPKITLSQGVQGGAAIGGLCGLGLVFFMEGLKTTAAATGNPMFLGIGAVIMGTAIGAAGGTLIANGNGFKFGVPAMGSVEVTSDRPPAKWSG